MKGTVAATGELSDVQRKRSVKRAGTHWGWLLSAWAVALLVLLPVLAVVYLALTGRDGGGSIWAHLASTVLPGYVWTSVLLMLGVALLAGSIGVTCAWLTSMYQFPLRRFYEWGLLLPFAVPANVIAYVYTDILEYAGPVQNWLREVFGWTTPRDYWFPEIRSLGGATVMISLVLYPYVFMLARAAFLEQSASLRDASRTLGCNGWQSFWRVSLPSARPAIAVGLALTLMEALNDFGTVDYFAVRTLTAGIFNVWLNMGSVRGAAQIALCLMIFIVGLIWIERHARRRQRQFGKGEQFRHYRRPRLIGVRGGLASLACFLPLGMGFFFPVGVLARHAVVYFEQSWTDRFLEYAYNSLVLASSAALLTLLIGVLLAYAKRLDRTRSVQHAVKLSSLGYAMPGAVIGLGVLVPLAGFDNALDAFMRDTFGISTGLLLTGSMSAIVIGYVVRFLAVSAGAIEASLDKVTPSMDMASRSLGENTLRTLWRVHLPLIRPGLLTAALVVFVDAMKELPATLLLRPFNFDTLATNVYQFASDELLERAALPALVIVAAGVLPVVFISRAIVASRREA
ncbi:iron(III) transport system permease protein [Modicisalibacter xianhensis]|uniref:Iron(III) transport system permease protein n=1 Tax=Modicisalibacter xianhensis TaxID=442341 RepID=A0A4R8FZ84_9GAMM|nr:iron ABC transporter permease [Halomonas xianhensis]TDX32397.1 iron(III) transport system permease protein [Halomonas xianhensis]